MKHGLRVVLTLGCVTVLSGCIPAVSVSAPPASPSASPTLETPAALPDLVLPECADLYTTDEVLTLMGERMQLVLPDETAEHVLYGTEFEELRAELAAGESLSCTWVLPATERGLTVSIMAASPRVLELVSTTLREAGSAGTSTDGESISFEIQVGGTPDFPPSAEAHYLSSGVWVSAFDAPGGSAAELTQTAMLRMATLNPDYFD